MFPWHSWTSLDQTWRHLSKHWLLQYCLPQTEHLWVCRCGWVVQPLSYNLLWVTQQFYVHVLSWGEEFWHNSNSAFKIKAILAACLCTHTPSVKVQPKYVHLILPEWSEATRWLHREHTMYCPWLGAGVSGGCSQSVCSGGVFSWTRSPTSGHCYSDIWPHEADF